jgi:hypothetical protein
MNPASPLPAAGCADGAVGLLDAVVVATVVVVTGLDARLATPGFPPPHPAATTSRTHEATAWGPNRILGEQQTLVKRV